MAKRAANTSKSRQRALVIGVSDYPSPIPKLPAVANDVREMAKVLASKNGVFGKGDVTVLTNRSASRRQVLAVDVTDAL